MMNTMCVYCSHEQFDSIQHQYDPDKIIQFPENGLMFEAIRQIPRVENKITFTTNPMVVTNYKYGEVFTIENGELSQVFTNLYGACFTISAKSLGDTKTLISNHIVTEMRSHIAISDEDAITYLDTLGDSMEKAYLRKRLMDK